MNILTLDFETYFADDFTLRKMTTEEYIRSDRFETLLMGVRTHNETICWLSQEQIPVFLSHVDWSQTAVLAHHAHFDGLILSHHYGVRPRFWFDTLSMGRMLHGNGLRLGLRDLAAHYGVGEKTVPYELFKGRRWANIPPSMRQELGEGCMQDCALTWELFAQMLPRFPRSELPVIDMTVRQFTEPTLIGDTALLEQIKLDEWTRKAERLAHLGVSTRDLQSAEKFCAMLEERGVEVERKTTPAGNEIPAIAKTDDFMKALLEHDDEDISLLAQARLDVRSTIDETRAGRLAGMSMRGPMPVYLQYCGAHTNRWSGGDKVNWHNFRSRGSAAGLARAKCAPPGFLLVKCAAGLARAICAPPGFLLVKCDASQIECRILNYVAGETHVIERFRNKEDPYVGIASNAYGRPVSKADKLERGTGKQLELSCGYGAGAGTIRITAARGTYGPPAIIDDATALRWRNVYRDTHPGVVRLWREGDAMLSFMGQEDAQHPQERDWGPAVVQAFGQGRGRIFLPIDDGFTGPFMDYQLSWDQAQGAWRRKTRRGNVRIWGGHLVENLIQWLSRQHTAQAALRLSQRWRVALTKHDEVLLVVPAHEAREALETAIAVMSEAPAWLPGIPLDAEGAIGERYGEME